MADSAFRTSFWSRVGHERGGMACHGASVTNTKIPVNPGYSARSGTAAHQRAPVEAEFESSPPSSSDCLKAQASRLGLSSRGLPARHDDFPVEAVLEPDAARAIAI